jgi:ABC-type molybdate transport system substrate-binding protein
MEKSLKVLSAGVAIKLIKDTAEQWNSANPDCKCEYEFGGSVDLARRIRTGEDCDFFVSADDGLIRSMLMPAHAEECCVFARNKMVIAVVEAGKTISGNDWQEKLLDPQARFAHFDPYGDPGGYRAVMCLLLADQVKPGLSQQLMDHPGHIGMAKNFKGPLPPHDYLFLYYSAAVQKGLGFAELPAVMNLSDPALEPVYNSVSFAVDEHNTVKGSSIQHAWTIPSSSQNKTEAAAFKKLFLSADRRAYNFF